MNDLQAASVLRVEGLHVYYGAFHAVRDVSFDVKPGEIFGFLGPNGAGKTSTLSAIEGLLKPRSGTISVAGYDVRQQSRYARANMGIQLQATSFQPELTITEIIRLYAGIYGVDMSNERIAELLQEINLQDAGGKRFGQLSGGQQQRVSLVIATIHDPRLVLLDEPTTGLDPQSRRQLWERIEAIREKGHGVLLTTHSMEEAEAVCDRIAIIDHGRIVAIDTPVELIERHRHNPEVISVSRRLTVQLFMIVLLTILVFLVGFYVDKISLSPAGYLFGFVMALAGGTVYLGLGQMLVGLIKHPETVSAITRLVYFLFIMVGMLGELGALGKDVQQAVIWSPFGTVKKIVSDSLQPAHWTSDSGMALMATVGYAVAFSVLGIKWFKWNTK